jgi:SSS family transporter
MGSYIDIAVVILYFVVLLVIGYLTSRRIKGTEDYTIAGRRLGYPALLGALIGTAIGAASTIGKAGKAYDVGIALFFATLAYGIGLFIFGFIAPTIRKIEIWTIPDALVLRYGSKMRLIVAIVMILAVVALFGGQLIATGLAVQAIFGNMGITYTEGILLAGIIMVVYTIMGGLLAVAYTDLFQTIIMIIGVAILLPIFVTHEVGGPARAWELMQPEPGNFWGGLTLPYIISIFLIDIPFCLIDPSLWQRASAARDATRIRNSMFATSGVYFYWSFIAVFLGVMAAYFFPNLAAGAGGVDSAIPVEITAFMPVGLKGFLLAALMAVMMSTASTALLISGTTFAHDIVRAYRPATSDKRLLAIARSFVLVIGVLGVVFALNMKGIFDVLLLAFAIFVSGAFVPTMAAIFWKKATRQGAIVSSIVASVLVVALYGLKLSGNLPTWIEPIIVSIAASLVLMVGISLLTYDPATATPRFLDRAK